MTRENLEQRTVDHFRIRSLTQWNFGNASMQPLVCVAYNSDTYDTFPIDSCVRFVPNYVIVYCVLHLWHYTSSYLQDCRPLSTVRTVPLFENSTS